MPLNHIQALISGLFFCSACAAPPTPTAPNPSTTEEALIAQLVGKWSCTTKPLGKSTLTLNADGTSQRYGEDLVFEGDDYRLVADIDVTTSWWAEVGETDQPRLMYPYVDVNLIIIEASFNGVDRSRSQAVRKQYRELIQQKFANEVGNEIILEITDTTLELEGENNTSICTRSKGLKT